MATMLDIVLTGGVMVFAVGLTLTTLWSLRASGNPRLRFVAAAFAVFAVKAMATAYSIFAAPGLLAVDSTLLAADLLILLMLYLSIIVYRKKAPEEKEVEG